MKLFACIEENLHWAVINEEYFQHEAQQRKKYGDSYTLYAGKL